MKIKPIKPILSVFLCFLFLGTIKVPADAYSLQEVEVLPSDSVVEISDAALESFILAEQLTVLSGASLPTLQNRLIPTFPYPQTKPSPLIVPVPLPALVSILV